MTAEDILKALAAPFPPEAVDWRVGPTNREKTKGMALAYIDARTVQDRLTQVCGPFWSCDHLVSVDGKKMTCRIGIKFGDEWVWRSDGAGDTDMEAEKGAFSDAFKRAAVKWGVGRYLYDLPSPWVELNDDKKTMKAGELQRLQKQTGGSAPAPAAPPPPAPALAPAAAKVFWARASYEITGKPTIQAFAESFCKACEQAPSTDAILKLDEDNKEHLATLRGADAPAYQKTRIAVSAAHSKFPKKAA